ncbi:glycosyltransferase family 39 protein [Paralcaligenes sp. KSB-10]|uniref:ArnT family glycosyltransferase n=1 Tax=Paralcaligenes sp. KSB-10 TaxID=2901142 RepID=UPI001E63198A|nr:glycosyltransferase family 39 protein [Paralcaligenes sp. KSB-10]UHL62653.1 glycosyltransferase family 39 protein [Paralcaligenes sp. KSB-10]
MKRLSSLVSRALDVQSTWLVALATVIWLSATAWTRPLILPDEGRYVGVAWGMLKLGDWAVPRLDGLPFFHKPPLFYWITALSMELFGVNEWAARLTSVLAATLIVSLAFWFLKKHVGQRLAIVAALILASQPFLFGAAQYANLDMTVAAMISATVIAAAEAVFRAERGEPYRRMLALAYGIAGLGFLAKGLIGIVLPGGIIFFWLLGRRRYDSLRRLFHLPAIGVFLLVSLPWMILMQVRYPGFFDYYIIYQHFERFLETGFNNPHPFWFYVPVLVVLSLPWSLQLWRVANKAYWKNPAHGALRGLMVSWLLVVLIFFSLPASKLVGYILPLLIPFAFFLAEPFAARLRGGSGGDSDKAQRTFSVFLAVSLGICLVAVVALVVSPLPSSKPLVAKMRTSFHPSDKIIMLGRYRYDVDFYLRSGKSAQVVSNWDDPSIKTEDTWRKELYDAGEFEPQAAAQLLIQPQALTSQLCTARTDAIWLMGDKESVDDFPFVREMTVYAEYGKLRVWRVEPGPALKFCAETPKSGPK